jgi:PAT family beta-lactamase induction signal transducer AmpG
MILLWIMWTRGFVVETVRQPGTEDDEVELAGGAKPVSPAPPRSP